MTMREAVGEIKKTLENINVPVSLIQSIGLPIAQSIQILDAIIQVFDEQEKQSKKNEAILYAASEDEVPEEVRNNG